MIISVNYHSSHRKLAGEVRCSFSQLGYLFDFIKSNPEKRYVIKLAEVGLDKFEKITEQIEFVKAVAQDYTVECDNLIMLGRLLESGYNCFLKFPVCDWETFTNLRELGVSDIYIDGPLGFSREKIEKGKQNCKIRVSPTVSPNASLAKDLTSSFYIRPEDMKLYEDMIDIIDFQESNQEKEDALFSIYNRGTFVYDINELIKGLPQGINNCFIKNDFVKSRLDCEQHCKVPGYRRCKTCPSYFFILENTVGRLLQDK